MELAPLPNGDQQDSTTRPLVLAVDDNEDNLILLTQILAVLGCSFLSFKNGHTAVNAARNYRPDLILLDVMLPDMEGIEVIRQLKQDPQTMKIPIVAVTAMARPEDRDRILEAGCNDYIKKPYMIDELEAIIRPYLFNV